MLVKKGVVKNCIVCDKSFYVPLHMLKKGYGKCCSQKCRGEHMKKPNNRKCEICGELFHVKPSRIKKGDGKYCSDKCRCVGAGKTNSERQKETRLQVACVICGKMKFIKPSHDTHERNYCSVVCMARDYKNRLSGESNPNYKDGRARDSKKYRNAYMKAKKEKDPHFRLRLNIGLRIYKALRDQKAGRGWESLVGYTLKDLTEHLEKLFTGDMSWGNYGEWHIDHKIPDSVFNYTKSGHEDFKRCWALKNLQPLWAIDNCKKGKKLFKHFQQSLALEV